MRVVVLVMVGVLEAGMVLDEVGEFVGEGVLLKCFVGCGEEVFVGWSSGCA